MFAVINITKHTKTHMSHYFLQSAFMIVASGYLIARSRCKVLQQAFNFFEFLIPVVQTPFAFLFLLLPLPSHS